jgi:hypothetical protein
MLRTDVGREPDELICPEPLETDTPGLRPRTGCTGFGLSGFMASVKVHVFVFYMFDAVKATLVWDPAPDFSGARLVEG